jgi:hypothetical protein
MSGAEILQERERTFVDCIYRLAVRMSMSMSMRIN